MLGYLLVDGRFVGALGGTLFGLALAVLQFFQSSGLRFGSNFRATGNFLFDIFETGSDDGTLDLSHLAGLFLGGGFRHALFVEPTPRLGPSEFGRFFALNCETVGFGSAQPDRTSVSTDHEFPVARVDAVLGECAQFGCVKRERGTVSILSIPLHNQKSNTSKLHQTYY